MNKTSTPVLTRNQTNWILLLCMSITWFGFLGILYGTHIEPEKTEILIKPPSVITVTPLDSPNPCWDPHYWSHIE